MSRLRREVRRSQEQERPSQMPQPLPLQFQWRRGPDMPFEMSGYIQSVLAQGKLYIGGGFADSHGSENNYMVMVYDTRSGRWAKLPPYRTRYFAMTVINKQLLLVGGFEHGTYSTSKALGVYSRKWTHPYPEMPTARSSCSAVTYNEWLIVAGGWNGTNSSSAVEILNTETKYWYTGPPTPVPWRAVKTALVGDMCYFMGGCGVDQTINDMVYSVSLPALISKLHSRDSQGQIWKKSKLNIVYSCPLSMSGSFLLTLGGEHNGGSIPDIHYLYQPDDRPDSAEWVKIGDLPSPRRNCTAMVTNDRELLVAGGRDNDSCSQVDIATVM